MGKPTFKCEKKCRDLCTWSPSNNPCRFPVRKCKHDCIGFEGDPCPSMCRICDKQSKEFEKSSEQDRFLVLTDCKHIVRFDDMERSIRERPTVVRLPSCPVCQVPVANSSRYGNLVKDRQEHIAVIYKDLASCATKPKDVIDKLKRLAGKSDADKRTKLLNACTAADSPSTHRLMTTLCEAMEAAQQGGPSDASARTMRGLCTYAKVLFMLNGCLRSVARTGSGLRREVARQVDALAAVLAARPRSVLSAQEVLDLNTELLRIQRLQQLCMVEEQAAQDGTDDLHSDDEYSKVSCIVRGTGPYPRKTLDDAVDRTIERLAASVQLGAQWWEEVELPRSAAQGSWYFCGKGHTYPKTGTERRCNKCPRDCMARILEDPS
ncbi:NFX1-type zinc finger-containing protein 1-like isoform X1 [Thrips palmi]|uniref:NFX1-type zinc finger-containing protein 1-like isoform X1 n=1 Tax=Thrips palmi TaxID=161013 RepID=A0A6P8YNR2_THRPL|nr:NFX1-type zinc finger-containing protein 1-like isoform X1 [Thrips palmi]